jgi:3-oxoacyl-[acyl-carrier-protein] synthase-1
VSADIHIVAVGARTPVGHDAASSAAAARAGISRLAEHPFMVDGAGVPLRCGRDPAIDPSIMGPQRLIDLVTAALTEAATAASSRAALPNGLVLFLGLPNPRPGFGASEASRVARAVEVAKLTGLTGLSVVPVVSGHAAAIQALELATNLIRERKAEICFVGGVDSYLDPDAIDWLEADHRVARDDVRGGFIPGEGAAVVVVAGQAGCARLGLRPLARVRNAATGQEPRSIDSDEGLLGEGLTDVVRRVSQDLRLPAERVDDIYCDINGERHRTDEWGFTILRASHAFRNGTDYTTMIGSWGDIGAASAALGCVLAVRSWQRGYASGPRCLVWGSSPEGLRGAAILEQLES